MSQSLEYWLIICHSGVSNATFYKLLQAFGNPKAIAAAPIKLLQRFALSQQSIHLIKDPDQKKLKQALQWNESPDHMIVTRNQQQFPRQLLFHHYLPNVLFVWGNIQLLHQPSLTIIGSRRPSETGRKIAYHWSQHLAQYGFVIVSGLARGIDTCCHNGTLNDCGKTIAVLGSGLQHIYPSNHVTLVDSILEAQGTIISEFPLYSAPYKWNFPIRNHTMSALSLATIVIEAGLKSGSLITAYAALEQGKEVFAVPGSVLNSTSQGCHKIIQEGAHLMESYQDIIDHFPELIPMYKYKNKDLAKKNQLLPLDEPHNKLLECIDYQLTSFDTIVIRSKQSTDSVRSGLQHLELVGFICVQMGRYIRVKI